MSAPNLEDIFLIGASVLGSTVNDSNNTISMTTGDAVTGETTGPKVQMWQNFGFASRPALAEPGIGSAQTINIVRANGDIAIAGRDLRDQAIYGNLGPGETCIYATGPVASMPGQARLSLKADGSVTMSTTGDSNISGVGANTAGGPGVQLQISPDKLSFTAPWGALVFDKTGFHIRTNAGAGFDLSNIPTTLAVSGTTMARISASNITLNAPTVCLGPDALSGGSTYLPAVFGILPATFPNTPILGVGVGAVTVAAMGSTKVLICP